MGRRSDHTREDLDDLIVHLNAETLDGLLEACRDVDLASGAEAALEGLARRYMRYVDEQPELWNAVFEHRPPTGRTLPAWYYERTNKLLGLADATLVSLIADNEERTHQARVLWASLYGIAALASSGKLAKTETAGAMVRSLIANYVGGLRARRLDRPSLEWSTRNQSLALMWWFPTGSVVRRRLREARFPTNKTRRDQNNLPV